MANQLSKYLSSWRRHKDAVASKKQLGIAKTHGISNKDLKEPHRYAKNHAMDCGNPKCALCGNPRHIHKDSLTAQEKRLFQDLDKQTDKHSNGLPKDSDINES